MNSQEIFDIGKRNVFYLALFVALLVINLS